MAGPGEHVSSDKPQVRAGEVMDEARAHAKETVHSAAQKGRDMWENQRRMAAVEVDGYACALREAARALYDQQQDPVAHYAEWTADGLDRLARNLREKDLRSMVDRVGDFARHQPGIFIGGTVVAGFLLSRFLKSSEKSHHEKLPEEHHDEAWEAEHFAESSESAPESGPYTAADVEVPIIIQPHGDVEHPGGPKP